MALSCLSGPQQRGVLLSHDDFPHPGAWRQTVNVQRQRIAGLHPQRGGIDHQLVSGRIGLHQGDIELRIVLMQPPGEGVRHLGPGIVQGQGADPRRREGGGDSRSHPAAANHQRPRPLRVKPFTTQAQHKSLAIEHVSAQATVSLAADGIAGASDGRRRAQALHQIAGGDFMRHRHQRADDVGHRKQRRNKRGVVLRPDPHRHHLHVHLLVNEPRVVDHRRLKTGGRIAKVRYQPRIPTNHHALLLCLLR